MVNKCTSKRTPHVPSPNDETRAPFVDRLPVPPHADAHGERVRSAARDPGRDATPRHRLADSPPAPADPHHHVTCARLHFAHPAAVAHDEPGADSLQAAPLAVVAHAQHASRAAECRPARAASDSNASAGKVDPGPSAVISVGMTRGGG